MKANSSLLVVSGFVLVGPFAIGVGLPGCAPTVPESAKASKGATADATKPAMDVTTPASVASDSLQA